ncbi:trypsin-like peptidase domain-containing protein [Plantibacter sp. Mn2098]|uniref:S1C family serine protease n=1 Tax=Plantibacter sp. Mn2098 TaxID=3395266 RepID=UPI003BC0DF56
MTDNTNGQQPADQPADQPAASPAEGAVPNDGQAAAAAREDAGAAAEQTQAPEAHTPAAAAPVAQTSAAQTPAAQTPAAQTPAAQTPAAQTPTPQAQAGEAASSSENTTEVLGHEVPNGQPTASYAAPQQPPAYQPPAQQSPYGAYQAPGQAPAQQAPAQDAPRFYPPSQPGAQQPGVQHPGAQQAGAQQHGAYQPGQYAQQPGVQKPQHTPNYAGAQQGVPSAFGTTHQAQQPGANPYAQQPSQTPPGPAKSKSNRGLAGMVAMLAVGALIGGASGAGATLWVTNANKSNVSDSSGSKSFTINDSNNVNLTTAIAATAGPSVVTIAVQSGQSAGTGSGIVLSDDGYILTNTHVVTLDGQIANPTIQVTDASGNIYQAKIVGTDPIYDLAVIKLQDASGLTPMEFANSDKLNVGDTAVAIGAPLGLSGTVTDGIVSALNRSITVASSAVPDTKSQDGQSGGSDGQNPFDLWNFDVPGQQQQPQTQNNGSISIAVIQTDAAINPGNSGGALLDDKGKLIGVNVAIASAGSSSNGSSQGGSIGVGFAIPSNIAKRVADEIIKDGKATHGLLGATVKDSSSDPSSKVAGALIDKPTANGAAEAAGLQSGDIVTDFNGVPIHGANDLTAQVRALAGGATAKVTFVRGGETKTVDVTLGTLQV